MVEDVLDGMGLDRDLRNFSRAGMAWTINSMPSAVASPISSIRPGRIGSNEHREVVELEHSEGIPIGVGMSLVEHSVLASAHHDDRVHQHQDGCALPRVRQLTP